MNRFAICKTIGCFLLLLMSLCCVGCAGKPSLAQAPSVDADADADAYTEVNEAYAHDLTWVKEKFGKYGFEPDVIYPISHILIEHVTPIGACEFVLRGFYGAEPWNEKTHYAANCVMIDSIEIRAMSGVFHQSIENLSTYIDPRNDAYGFDFGDWNGDGIIDFKLRRFEGGTMRNEPSLFWLWDNAGSVFAENEELEEISDTATVYLSESEESSRLKASTRIAAEEYYTEYYEYRDGHFVCVETEYLFVEEQDGARYKVTQISKLTDGEMKIIGEDRTKLED